MFHLTHLSDSKRSLPVVHWTHITALSLVLAILLILLTGSAALAQENPTTLTRNALYFELFGQGLLYSINYDYRLTPEIGFRAGYSSWTLKPFFLLIAGELKFTSFPLMVNYLTKGESGHLELGVGIMPSTVTLQGREILFGSAVDGKKSVLLGTATIGYRWQPFDGGTLFRIGLTPLFTRQKIMMTGGVSVGYTF